MLKYKWKSSGFNADATSVGQELEKIENDGEITSEAILRYAKRNSESELYKCFEWDNDIASEKYRKMQASSILTSIVIVTDDSGVTEETTRAYVSIKNADDKRTYKNIVKVLDNDDELSQLKQKAFKDFSRCKERYEKIMDIEDLKEVVFDLYKNM